VRLSELNGHSAVCGVADADTGNDVVVVVVVVVSCCCLLFI
jgi:hypothetical protein